MQSGPSNPKYVYVSVTIIERKLVRVLADSDDAKNERGRYGGPGGWAQKQVHAAGIGKGLRVHTDVLGEDGGYWLTPNLHSSENLLPGGIVFIKSPKQSLMSEENLASILELFKAEGVEVRGTWNNGTDHVSVQVAKMPDDATLAKLTAQMAHLEPLRTWDSTGGYGHKSRHEDRRSDFESADILS